MTPPFVKKFDFRGIYNKDIFDKDAYFLGLAIIRVLQVKNVLVGWDTRVSSKNLALRFIQALEQHGINVSFLDVCSIDYVTAAANACDFDFSVMFTGSHNPWDWTGLLMHTKGGDSVQGQLVEQIVTEYTIFAKEDFSEQPVDLLKHKNFITEIEDIISNKISELIPLENIKSLSVVVDLGDGSGSVSLSLLERLLPQVTFKRLHDRKVYDASSSHVADPSNIENMHDVITEVKTGTFDAGFAFDSDADRVLAVDEKGNYLNGSLCGSAMVDIFALLNSRDQKIGYAVDCGPSLYNTVSSLSNRQFFITPIPVGRSIIRQMIRDMKIDVGVENVGHFYIRNFFLTDSGAFSLVLILYWISMYGPLSTLLDKHSDGWRGQVFYPLNPTLDEQSEKIIQTIIDAYKVRNTVKITVDGVRYEMFFNEILVSWIAIRQSGYESIKKFFWGSIHKEEYEYISQLMTQLKSIK